MNLKFLQMGHASRHPKGQVVGVSVSEHTPLRFGEPVARHEGCHGSEVTVGEVGRG